LVKFGYKIGNVGIIKKFQDNYHDYITMKNWQNQAAILI